MPKTTGPRFVAETLRACGVSHVFFVPQMLLETLTPMEGMGIRRVMTHGEKAAAYMADGYARAGAGACRAPAGRDRRRDRSPRLLAENMNWSLKR